eukprot:GEMP01023428.1.p1 GENE.GEMP01023428.1~~GEMP01023428.1.p1  ORF type:complete len:524 (+),score=88.08 GEMP01023428.1:61-1632(+)
MCKSSDEDQRRKRTCLIKRLPLAKRRKMLALQIKGKGRHITPRIRALGSSNWAERMIDVLASSFVNCEGSTICVTFGTDCSGAEAPVFALRELKQALRKKGCNLLIKHEFACDVELHSRNFIAHNCNSTHIFGDLTKRTEPDLKSYCYKTYQVAPVPVVDLYVAGFPCKDFSFLNKNRQCLDGPHAKVFFGVCEYIRTKRPRCYILENVMGITKMYNGVAPIVKVMEYLRAIPGYQVKWWPFNTRNFYTPQTRGRVYIVGVQTEYLQKPMDQWGWAFEELKNPEEVNILDFLWKPNPEPDEEGNVNASDVMEILPLVKEEIRLFGRKHEQKERERERCRRGARSHQGEMRYEVDQRNARSTMGLDPDARPTKCMTDSWLKLLTEREKGQLDCRMLWIEKKFEEFVTPSVWVQDLSQNFLFSSFRFDGLSPTIIPSGKYWVYPLNRYMLPLEMMSVQGFPVHSLILDGLSQTDIASLAGNAMSVPVIGAVLACALFFVDFAAGADESLTPLQNANRERKKNKLG